jgi:hypothetical protein
LSNLFNANGKIKKLKKENGMEEIGRPKKYFYLFIFKNTKEFDKIKSKKKVGRQRKGRGARLAVWGF